MFSISLQTTTDFTLGGEQGPQIQVGRRICFSAYANCQDLATIGEVHGRQIRILAVDHNPLLREGLSLLIHLHPDMELVGVVASGKEAVEAFMKHRPDVTLMDLDLPSAGGIKALQEILAIDPAARVLGLLTYEWDESRTQALRAGARTCITKDRLNQDLVSLVRSCAPRAETFEE